MAYAVASCRCGDDYRCIPPAEILPIQQDESLSFCIFPVSPNDASLVEISNFFTVFEAGSELNDDFVSYQPVSYGSTTWQSDPLTLALEGPFNRVRITAPIVAAFFLEGHTSFNVRGNAMLEFASSDRPNAYLPLMSLFDFKVDLNNDFGVGRVRHYLGRLRGILESLLGGFGIILEAIEKMGGLKEFLLFIIRIINLDEIFSVFTSIFSAFSSSGGANW